MPRAPGGDSIYWASLNKGKKSVALALDTPQGQEIARRIVCAPGSDAGILLTNLPARGWMDSATLHEYRPDLITVRLTGNYDGSSAMDYTVNCASGFPVATGVTRQPVNHVLPAWDVAAGLYIAVGLLAAERLRRSTGQGQEIKLALSDVMLATVANLGYVADVQVNGVSREPIGNDLYGAFGRNFATVDGRELMIVAISKKQWQAIGKATGLTDRLAMIGPMLGVDLATEEGLFEARDAIAAVLKPWFAKKTLSEAGHALDVAQVLWGPYQDFSQLVRDDPRCSTANPMFGELDQPGIGRVLSPRSPLAFSSGTTPAPLPAPALGADTASVLQSLLGLSPDELVRLEQQDIVGTSIHSIR
jgi:2-methylfumaryl-CoA isomerase